MTRILITTTVPETLATILKGQPGFLSNHFEVELATSPGDFASTVKENEGLTVHAVPMTRGINLLEDLQSLLRMIRLLRKSQPVLVHSYTPKAGLITMLAAAWCRIPVRVHTFTGLIFPTTNGIKQRLLIWMDRLLCACATHVVPEGLGVQKDLEQFHITRKPLAVIGNGNIAGVDTAYFSSAAPGVTESADLLKQKLHLGPNDFLFCFVGRLNKDKGLIELLEAFETLPSHAHLLLIGDIDHTAPVGDATLAVIRSNPRVHSLGFLGDIRPALCAADLLVLPSYREGFPNVLLEAGAMGLPVIASDINGCNEVIEPGVNGWLVPPRDAGALSEAMQLAMHTPAPLRSEMGRTAHARVAERFERKHHWQRMVLFYQDLLAPAHKGKKAEPQRFLLVAGLSDSLLNFRGPLIKALLSRGLNVHVAAPHLSPGNSTRLQLEKMGLTVHSVTMNRTSTNPLTDLATLWTLWTLMRRIRPNFVLNYTIKPVIYGSIASWLAGVPHRFALITGLGYAFQDESQRGGLRALVQRLYTLALSRVHLTFFQNPDDLALFRQRCLLPEGAQTCVVNGSGVDVASFAASPLPQGAVRFLLIARLLGDKGVREYAQAARQLKSRYPEVQFALVGWIDSNPNAISQSELDAWVATGSIDFLGRMSDVRPAIEACSVYVLPSYREGTPRTVLEAMAMGRPVITTDAPGCRETVVDGENGFLVPVKSVDALIAAMERFVSDPELATRMGARGRQMAEQKYDVHKVNAAMLSAMDIP